MKYTRYQSYYSSARLSEKIERCASKAGEKIIKSVLILYYTAIDPNTSAKDKTIIYSVLGYFILPIDVIPDGIPFIGFTDDLSALIWGCAAVAKNITPQIRMKADKKVQSWIKTEEEISL